jgi:hypothetical protein
MDVSEWWIQNYVKGGGRGLVWGSPGIYLEGVSKTTKHLGRNSQRSCSDSNPTPLKCKEEALPFEATFSALLSTYDIHVT